MIIEIEKQRIEIDFEKTIKDYETRELCDCQPCQNFQAQINDTYSKLTDFLKNFGIDIRKTDEIFFNDLSDGTIAYPVYYTVFGKILENDVCTVNIFDDHGVFVTLKNGEPLNHGETDNYIVFSVDGIKLANIIDNT